MEDHWEATLSLLVSDDSYSVTTRDTRCSGNDPSLESDSVDTFEESARCVVVDNPATPTSIAVDGTDCDKRASDVNGASALATAAKGRQKGCEQSAIITTVRVGTVLRHHVRDAFAQMYLGTVNSGDLEYVRGFYSTHMAKSCKFVFDHRVNKSYQLPSLVRSSGLDQFCQHAKGVMQTFPDLVAKFRSARVELDIGWRGTCIVIQTEMYGNRPKSLPKIAWLPGTADNGEVNNAMEKGRKKRSMPPDCDDISAVDLESLSASSDDTNAAVGHSFYRREVLKPMHICGTATFYLDEEHRMRHLVFRHEQQQEKNDSV